MKRNGSEQVKIEERRVPEWEELVYTPGVFVRVANTGLTRYGKRKSAQALEKKGREIGGW
jgi:hypothetical protein